MENVYVVLHWADGENRDICGLYKNHSDAYIEANKIAKEYHYDKCLNEDFWDSQYGYVEVEKWIVK